MFDSATSARMNCADIESACGRSVQVGGGGAVTTFICGSFETDRLDARPLIAVLPTLLHLKLEESRSLTFHHILDMLADETGKPGLGSEAAIGRLFEMLFVHAIRVYAAQPASPLRGWLAALADPALAKAIAAIHVEPGRPWTVGSLAKAANMSRSAFAVRFKAIAGHTPLEYLTQWRIYRARRQLQKRRSNITDIARAVGYESVAAFYRAFRKETGTTPGEFRKGVTEEMAP